MTRATPPLPILGLTETEARRLLDLQGANELGLRRSESALLREFLALCANPLVLILIAASVTSALMGEAASAGIILLIVLMSLGLNLHQTYHSQKAIEGLRTQVAPVATVLRDGKWRDIDPGHLVAGDVIRLSAGDLVPADAELMDAHDLHVQEAALTGESLPVEKCVTPRGNGTAPDRAATVLLGTSVASGTGLARIFATGKDTAFGAIAERLATRPPETEFERGMHGFSRLITKAVILLVLFIFLVLTVLRHNSFESFLFAIAVAVGLTPEFLPMIISVTLAQGAVRMSRRQVIVKRLSAMQNLGSMDVLCSDKTGTLTTGTLTLESFVDLSGRPSETTLQLGYVNSLYGNDADLPAVSVESRRGGAAPLDAAILRQGSVSVEGFRKVDILPFDFERRRSTVVAEHNGRRILITKGAPESVLEICSHCVCDGETAPLNDELRAIFRAEFHRQARLGLRTLAVASGDAAVQPSYRTEDEKNLTFSGFLTFTDPPRAGSAAAIRSLREDGVEVKILTGDNEIVASHLWTELGMPEASVILGTEMESLTDAALGHLAERTNIFARVSPAQKNRVLLALKQRGHVAGFLGDGINDAPSLHCADVGISVSNATDVARDAADVILTAPGLDVLHGGILEGRKAFGNMMKYLLMGTSSNFGNMLSMSAASVFLPFLPMTAAQVLLNNFLYDLAQVAIPSDRVDESFTRKPRRWDIRLIRDFMIWIGPISSVYDFVTFYVLRRILHAGEAEFHTGWFVESLATQTLILFVIRTAGNPFRSRPSVPMTISTLAVALTAGVLPFIHPVAAVLGFVPLPFRFYAFLAAATLTYLVFVELAKRRLFRQF
jgi:Mg2+-importing ATPase